MAVDVCESDALHSVADADNAKLNAPDQKELTIQAVLLADWQATRDVHSIE